MARDDRLEEFQELGGAAGEVAALLKEVTDGFGHGVGVGKSEGLAHFYLGTAKGGAGGHGPGERVGASSGGRVGLVHAAEGDGDRGAEGGDDFRPGLFEHGQEAVFGEGGEGREVDGEGAAGEVGGARPAAGDGEEDGALVVLLEGFGAWAHGFAEGSAEAGGEAAEGIGEVRGEGGEVIEGENPVMAGKSEEVLDGGRDGGEGRGAGIDEGPEDAGGEGLAGAGGSLKDEDGERAIGAEGGQEPGEAAEPVGAGRQIETGAEGFEGVGRGRRGHGRGEGESGAGGLEEGIGAGGGLPAGGRDFDKLAFGIGEVEENVRGYEAAATGSDATPDGEALVLLVVVGLGFQVIDDSVESVGARERVELGIEFVEEPLAVGAGADGEDVETFEGGGIEANEGLAVGGGEGSAAPGDGDEGSEGVAHGFLLIPV